MLIGSHCAEAAESPLKAIEIVPRKPPGSLFFPDLRVESAGPTVAPIMIFGDPPASKKAEDAFQCHLVGEFDGEPSRLT